VLPRLLRLRPVTRESTDLDLDFDLDRDRDRDRESSFASFLALCLSYSPATAAPVTPAAAIGTPSRILLGLRLPLRFRDLLRLRCISPATAALARPTCAVRLLRCLGSMCLLALRDLPPSSTTLTERDLPLLELPLLELPLLDFDLLERDRWRCSSTTVVFSLFLRPTAYARAPTPAMAASVPISRTLDLLRPRP
jgi:hypothetical protein